jgi:hypothetical protein
LVEWYASEREAANGAAHWRRISQRIESIEILQATRRAVRANPARTKASANSRV